MSSLHPEDLLVEGSEPAKGTGSTLRTARGTSRKSVGTKVTTVPTPHPGKVQSTGSAQTITGGSVPAARTRRPAGAKAAVAAGTLAARAKAATSATSKAASATAATAKVATAKAAGAAKAAAVAKGAAKAAAVAQVANRAAAARGAKASAAAQKSATKPAAAKPAAAAKTVAAKPAAKPATATAAPAKAVPAKAASSKPATAQTTAAKPAATATATTTAAAKKPVAAKKPIAKAPVTGETAPAAVRPTPYKRPVVAEPVAVEVPPVPVVEAAEVVSSVADGRRRFLRRPPTVRRRPALYLAAALVGALSVSGFFSGDPAAQATSDVSQSVSVAQELGIEAAPSEEVAALDATRELASLAASRSDREAEQAEAAQVQLQADQAAAAAAAEAARPKAVVPVQGARLTSGFGARWGTLHAGIDLAAPMRTPEYAAMDGVVLEAGPASGYGLVVYIQHANGDVTVYGHMDEIVVSAGQVVKAGETIALVGSRGQSTGPHLHFEVRIGGIDGEKVDPIPYLRERGVQI